MSRWPAKEAMQERILDTAGRLFYGQGIRAVGVDTIAAEIGISKRTLYNYYPSKDELIVAYLARWLRPPKTSDRPLIEQILRIFDLLERWFASESFRGCPFVNAIAELGDADEVSPGSRLCRVGGPAARACAESKHAANEMVHFCLVIACLLLPRASRR